MSKFALIASLLLASSHALAQDDVARAPVAAVAASTVSTMAHVDDAEVPRRGRLITHHGYYAAPSLGITTLNHDVAPMIGMRSAWLVNRTLGVGLAFNLLANQVDEEANYKGRALGAYGGLLLQYIVGSNHLVHGFVDTIVGGGSVCQQTGGTGDDDCVGHSFFVLEPTANVEINVFRAMRVSVGAGYRLAIADSSNPLSNSELGGFVSKAALQFGKF